MTKVSGFLSILASLTTWLSFSLSSDQRTVAKITNGAMGNVQIAQHMLKVGKNLKLKKN